MVCKIFAYLGVVTMLRKFKNSVKGAALVETGMLLALICMVCMGSINCVSDPTQRRMCTVAQVLRVDVEGKNPPKDPNGGGSHSSMPTAECDD